MTAEELREIERRAADEGRWDTDDAIQAFADRRALLAEVRRLREENSPLWLAVDY